jgi:hypothetical protein
MKSSVFRRRVSKSHPYDFSSDPQTVAGNFSLQCLKFPESIQVNRNLL